MLVCIPEGSAEYHWRCFKAAVNMLPRCDKRPLTSGCFCICAAEQLKYPEVPKDNIKPIIFSGNWISRFFFPAIALSKYPCFLSVSHKSEWCANNFKKKQSRHCQSIFPFSNYTKEYLMDWRRDQQVIDVVHKVVRVDFRGWQWWGTSLLLSYTVDSVLTHTPWWTA